MLRFLNDGGEMGERMRAHDWAASPIGPPAGWPQTLRALVGVMLGSHQPMFVTWGPERIMLYNDGYAALLGNHHPAALGERFEVVWSDILDDVGPILDKAYAGEGTHMDDIAFTMFRNGYPEETHFAFSYTPVRDEEGEVSGMFCVCAETTDAVLAERDRVAEEERLRLLFDRAPGLMAVLKGPDHVFELANRSYHRLIGDREVVGKPIREALPDIAGQGFFELLDQVYASGEPYTGYGVSVSLSRACGAPPEDRVLDFIYQPMHDAAGAVTGIFVEGYDITDRHRAERALGESEDRFRLIADSAPVPIWVTKLDRRRGFVNRAYIDFLGVSYEEAVDFDWRRIIHPDDAGRIVAESLAGEETLEPFVLEGRYRRADGEWRWLRSQSQPRWGPDGEHAGFIGVAHDITDAKEAEARLRELNEALEGHVADRTADLSAALDRLHSEITERERAEEALRQAQKMEAIGQLTGGIAHDFNNLLTPIMGGLELILARSEDERVRRMAEGGLEAARRGARLTGQLLAFSRIQRISMAPVPVNAVIGNLMELMLRTLGPSVHVETDLDPGTGDALCDANQLENALLNLAINARDAMPEGGRLTICSGRETLPGDAEIAAGAYVCIAIADTGGGMSEDVAARAFEPFFSTKPVGKGTGLGLAQVYGIARQAGGTVRIESKVGEGTLIRIILPAAESPLVSEEPSAHLELAVPMAAADADILAIDDDPQVRDLIVDLLGGLGYRVRTAAGGEEGVEAIAASSPDLLLLDYAMPGMTGADVARKARALNPNLPIVFLTGFAETDRIEAAAGSDTPLVRKPFRLAELARVVADQLTNPC